MLNKARQIILGVALYTVSLILSSQTWFEISMDPGETSVVLLEFSGVQAFPYITAIATLALATLVIASLLPKIGRISMISLSSFATLTGALLVFLGIRDQDLRNLAKDIETATGIAAAHGLSEFQISTLPVAGLSCLALLGSGVYLAAIAYLSRNWQKKRTPASRATAFKKPSDAISLWDQQR